MTAPHHRGRYLDRYFGRALRRNATGVASREVVYGFDLIRGFAPALG